MDDYRIFIAEAKVFFWNGVLHSANDHFIGLVSMIGISPIGDRGIPFTANTPFISKQANTMFYRRGNIIRAATLIGQSHHAREKVAG